MEKNKYVGQSVVRIDGKVKISGAAKFVDDFDFGADLLYAAVVESKYAHAIINSIDTTEAEKFPGVVKVVSGKEFPFRFGLYMHDRYIFAQDRVRFIGEQVAAVIARTPEAAKKAAKLVKVNYTELPPVLNVEDALAKDAFLIHPELRNRFRKL